MPDNIAYDQEIGCKTLVPDDFQLVVQTLQHGIRKFAVTAFGAAITFLLQVFKMIQFIRGIK